MKTKWFFLGCLTSVVLLIAFVALSFLGLLKLSSRLTDQQLAKINPGTVLHLKISGEIIEYNEFYDNYFKDLGNGSHEIIQKINRATRDENVEAILLEPSWIVCGYAVLNEIKTSLEEFQRSGKKVYAYLERAGNKDYLLAAVADEIFLNPSASAGILLTGIGSSAIFYKDLFDKIGVEVTVIHAGEYKGFGESYSRRNFSKPVKENLNHLYTDIYERVIEDLSDRREIPSEKTRNIFEQRPELFISAESAIQYGLVDELLHFEDLVTKICPDQRKLINFNKYKSATESLLRQDQIAVVYLQGEILESDLTYGAQFINFEKVDKILDKLETNPLVKGVVLRINSPGGSALESEIIHDRILKLKEHKTVIISMSNVAASGGYYISAPGDLIFADPFTITGSIGVATIIPNFKQMADKIGISTDPIKKGKYVDVFNPFVEPDAATFKALKLSSDNIYSEFLSRVSEGRSIDLEELKNIAGGRVWSSNYALDSGLIDEIGILRDAVNKAAELAGLTDFQIKYYPEKRSIFQEFINRRFNLSYMYSYLRYDLEDEFGLTRLYLRYKNLLNDPVQAIIPFELD
ncbi:MAG: hypothetical protein APR54_04860 [Candidatus Cloacimonas sp. SDB]|nr:MAG: hypothetical protein APR54_04860 [Candidatus Cloacimonas sp. SDB]